jgi:hypothetical protein
MRNIRNEQERKEIPEPDPYEIFPKEFHNLINVFSKKAADTLPEHRKSDYYITFEKNVSQLSHASLYRMSDEKLEFCKKYIDKNLSKGFIEISSALWVSLILFVQKPGGNLRFCVNYRKLNVFTKKNRYSIFFIEETLV